MCGVTYIDGQRLEIDCEVHDPVWWKNPCPVFDFTRLTLDRPIPGSGPERWRAELTEISRILTAVSQFEDTNLSDRLGTAVAEVGNSIAEQAQVDVRFEWSAHNTGSS